MKVVKRPEDFRKTNEAKLSHRWHQVKLRLSSSTKELMTAFLFRWGCIGVEETDDGLVAYFPEEVAITTIKRQIEQIVGALSVRTKQTNWQPGSRDWLSIDTIAEQNWQLAWKMYFKPIFISQHIVIVPEGEKFVPTPNQIVIVIRPGQAFGTGTHPTTQLVLRALEKWLSPDMRVLDVGTGSGILAIAAAKLGARSVVANDIDPMALENAHQNVQLNQPLPPINFLPPSVKPAGKFDLILANLTSQVLLELLPDFNLWLDHNGKVIASGILQEAKEKFVANLHIHDWKLLEQISQDEWTCLVICPKS